MLNKKEFDEIRKDMAEFDKQREQVIKKSREIVKLSKLVIYAVHRDTIDKAAEHVKEIKKCVDELNTAVENKPKLVYSGSFKVAIQEFVEAVCYFEFVKNKKVPSHKELGVGSEYYLLGLCDLTGELVRKAVNEGINANYKQVVEIKELVADIYGEFIKMDITDGELRKKYDAIKYDLKKLEDLVLELKIKDKVK
jgi:predicted translin family RNA/ssDNA-binding protein